MIAGGPGVPDRGWRQDTLARHGESTRVCTRSEPAIGNTWLYGCQACAAGPTVCRGAIQGMREAGVYDWTGRRARRSVARAGEHRTAGPGRAGAPAPRGPDLHTRL